MIAELLRGAAILLIVALLLIVRCKHHEHKSKKEYDKWFHANFDS